MKEDIIAANLSSIRQSIEELKKNNASQSPQNAPNWVELENKIAQAAANEVRILWKNVNRNLRRKKSYEKRKLRNIKILYPKAMMISSIS